MNHRDTRLQRIKHEIGPVSPLEDHATIDLEAVHDAQQFGKCLHKLRNLAGPLSNREIERRSKKNIGRTKIGQAVDGELPNRDFLEIFLHVCGISHPETQAWFSTWARLSTGSIDEKPAETPPNEFLRKYGGETNSGSEIRQQADAELFELRQRQEAVEERRDAAERRASDLAEQLERLHETSLKRAQEAEDEREKALERVVFLTRELERVQDADAKRIRQIEEDRDVALSRTQDMMSELDVMHAKIGELRGFLTNSTKELGRELGIELDKVYRELSRLGNQVAKIGEARGYSTRGPANDDTYDEWGHKRENLFEADDLRAPGPLIGPASWHSRRE
ncbi:hypothetical protein [Amycolatopsis magusensis]|uniref:DNA repair exonuclease SbcCD ATPase subunit n=1 Tax=Amycolatopsis magusensis TaxID=882444 RepID=A0ABS4Q3Y3_9PSEU|nr:hypothetical protein [Amycolatopsis magusensis]MBP2186385.1 DNA repair exonuclease SbcCD ATPase subunit [Amycolatopsis magusensis]